MSNTAGIERAGPAQWAADLSLGVKLTVGARRSSWGRLLLTAIGVGLGVVVLLLAAAGPHVIHKQQQMSHRLDIWPQELRGVVEGNHPIRVQQHVTRFEGHDITVYYLQRTGHNPNVPLGVQSLPDPGAAIVSPALAHLLSGSDGDLLRPRFPSVTGTIGKSGLVGPADLRAYVGAENLPRAEGVYDFPGTPFHSVPLPALLWVLLVVGVVVLLFPVFVFVVASARLSGASRDRRLAALRLVGGSSAQVRRIAAGEALLGSILGLLIGGGLFLAIRPALEGQELAGVSVFASDIIPATPLIVLIALAIPTVTVATALFALRDTIIEPLGVVRRSTPPKRRLLWRLVVPVAGAGLLLRSQSGATVQIVAGVILLLLSVPLLLPWIVQQVIGRIGKGTPSWELAAGRLQLDSATPSRVVSGVAVVLAGAIALFSLLLAADRSIGSGTPAYQASEDQIRAAVTPASLAQAAQMTAAVRKVPGVHASGVLTNLTIDLPGDTYASAVVGSCEAFRLISDSGHCRDGEVFSTGSGRFRAGQTLRFQNATGAESRFVLPALHAFQDFAKLEFTAKARTDYGADVFITTAALHRLPVDLTGSEIIMRAGTSDEVVEHVRAALAPYAWRVSYVDSDAPTQFDQDARSLDTIRRGLYIGAVLTLALAAASMLVVTIEQIRERRRPLASLAASGVPRWLLARSLLWQNAIPVVLALAVSIGTGLLLGALTLRIAGAAVAFDLPGVAILTGLAAAVVAVASALTLPAVWQATRLTALREE